MKLTLIVRAALILPLVTSVAQAATFVVTNTDDAGPGSLRFAITQANATPTLVGHRIIFDIPQDQPQNHVIQPESELPKLDRRLLIDGFSQPGSSRNTRDFFDNAVRRIFLRGESSPDSDGLTLAGPNQTIRGLAIGGFKQNILIQSSASDAHIEGNQIGVTPGVGPNVAGERGIVDRADETVIGGFAADNTNVIRGHGVENILLGPTASDTLILRNIIGRLGSVAACIGFGDLVGITFSSSATIGAPGHGNVIACHITAGIRGGRFGVVQDNRFDLNNTAIDVNTSLATTEWLIGGRGDGESNRFEGQGDDDIVVRGGGANVTIAGNEFVDSRGLPIDLNGDGPTANDEDDADTGPNLLQNFPEITAVDFRPAQGVFQVSGRLPGAALVPNPVTLDFYLGRRCLVGETLNISRHDLAETLSFANGEDEFSVALSTLGLDLPFIFATATDADGNTSEISPCVDRQPPFVVTNTQDAGPGSLREAILGSNATADTADFFPQ